MSIQKDSAGLSPDYMSCLVNVLRDVMLFHNIDRIHHRLVQPLSLVVEVDKDRLIWLQTNTESGMLDPHFYYGLQAYWRVVHGADDAFNTICSCHDNGKVAIFRTDWSKVPYSGIYMNRRADWHVALILAYLRETDQYYIADRNNARAEHLFNHNRVCFQRDVMKEAFDDFFALLEYEFVESSRLWVDVVHQLIKESITNMNSQLGRVTAHQEFGFRAFEHLSWIIRSLETEEMASKRLQWLFRGGIPRSIRTSIIGNRKIFFGVLNEIYRLEKCGLESLVRHVQQGWRRLSRLLVAIGRDLNEISRQECLDQIERVFELEQRIIMQLERLC